MRLSRSFLIAALLLPLAIAAPQARAAVFVSVAIAPPAIPVYVQPAIPAPGYVWIPGYWAYGPDGYYWIPGTWVLPPAIGLLWTPGYWDWSGGVYAWHAGYWGPHVGFYGGVNYGFGYFGVGYVGGYWRDRTFYYNTAVNNVGTVHITNVYNQTVVDNASRVSYHGGSGGTRAQPTAQEMAAAREHHVAATAAQTRHVNAAAADPALRSSVNHGRPTNAATARPGQFGAAATTHRPSASPRNGKGQTTANPTNGRGTSATGTAHSTVSQPRGGTAPTTTNRPSKVSTPTAGAPRSMAAQPHGRAAPQPTPRPPAMNQPHSARTASGGAHRPTTVSRPRGPTAPVGGAPKASAPHAAKSPAPQARGHDNKTEGH